MIAEKLYGVIAEFESVEAVGHAANRATEAGYRQVETFSPFPITRAHTALGHGGLPVAYIAIAAGIAGALAQYFAQYWMNAVDYPLNVGGRPLHSWPAFIPATVIVAILWAGAAALIGMLALCRLPRLHHPLFAVPGFERATVDRFFLCIRAEDPRFEAEATGEFLRRLNPISVQEVPS